MSSSGMASHVDGESVVVLFGQRRGDRDGFAPGDAEHTSCSWFEKVEMGPGGKTAPGRIVSRARNRYNSGQRTACDHLLLQHARRPWLLLELLQACLRAGRQALADQRALLP